jgi:protein involved in polysaccharide export with SLBB domain
MAGVSANPGIFHASDAVRIRVFPDTSVFPNGIYPIGSDGIVHLPLLGPVEVTGISPDSLITLITPVYSPFVRTNAFAAEPLIRLSLQGGFHQPGLYWFSPHENLWGVMQRAGGTLREDGFRKMQLIRDGIVRFNSLDLHVQAGDELDHIGLKTGDQIWVTPNPYRTFWQAFRQDALPVLTFVLASATTAIVFYNFYDNYTNQAQE